ncbi:MAG: hypothetical protein RL367_1318, partial [Pseudomonadota bacterium]
MAEVFRNDDCLWVDDVGCRQTRVALLALEPGSQIWLSVDETPVLFERMADEIGIRGYKPVGENAQFWLNRGPDGRPELLELDFVERPADTDQAGSGYYKRDAA